jgi:hypothetical protein
MRRIKWIGWLAGLCCCCWGFQTSAQSFEVQELLLDIQKLAQEKQLLSDLYNGYKVLSSGYGAIRDVSKGSFDLHRAFLDGLLAVSPTVRNYKKVADIITKETQILSSYQTAWSRVRQDPHFTPEEVLLAGTIYSALLDQTLKNLGTLTTILTDGALRAGDAERLQRIDALDRNMQDHWTFLQSFNNQAALLSLERAADGNDYEQVKRWYGLTN